MKTERGETKIYSNQMEVTLENGRKVVCYGNNSEQAMGNAWVEFGIKAISAITSEPKIVEYFAIKNDVYAVYDDGTEQFVLTSENSQHAEETLKKLNYKS